MPHMPQLDELLDVSTHTPPHKLEPVAHAHTPRAQVVPPPHRLPHAPQLVLLF